MCKEAMEKGKRRGSFRARLKLAKTDEPISPEKS
jgi:hypothetical protein